MSRLKPASIPLITPDSEVLAWACGLCRRIASPMYSMGPMDVAERARAAERLKGEADRCCVCRGCGVVDGSLQWRKCAACEAKEAAAWEAKRPEVEAKMAAEEKTREETYAVALDKAAADALATAMSNISEECYCAGWLSGLEFTLWSFLASGPGNWGMGEVTADDLRVLRTLSEKCGGWIAWRDDAGEVFVPLAEWLPMYAAEQERSKAWLAAYEANQAARKAEEGEGDDAPIGEDRPCFTGGAS